MYIKNTHIYTQREGELPSVHAYFLQQVERFEQHSFPFSTKANPSYSNTFTLPPEDTEVQLTRPTVFTCDL